MLIKKKTFADVLALFKNRQQCLAGSKCSTALKKEGYFFLHTHSMGLLFSAPTWVFALRKPRVMNKETFAVLSASSVGVITRVASGLKIVKKTMNYMA
jgi:hypothetical protein